MLTYEFVLEEALVLQAKINKLPSPARRTTRALKAWISGSDVDMRPKLSAKRVVKPAKEKKLDKRPKQFHPKNAAYNLFDDEKDLVSIHPPADEDLTAKFVSWAFGPWLLVVSLLTAKAFEQTAELNHNARDVALKTKNLRLYQKRT